MSVSVPCLTLVMSVYAPRSHCNHTQPFPSCPSNPRPMQAVVGTVCTLVFLIGTHEPIHPDHSGACSEAASASVVLEDLMRNVQNYTYIAMKAYTPSPIDCAPLQQTRASRHGSRPPQNQLRSPRVHQRRTALPMNRSTQMEVSTISPSSHVSPWGTTHLRTESA